MPRKKSVPRPDETSCVIYARFSSERQREESIEDQVRVCSEWAEDHGLTVTRVYADRAISGTSDERPEFLRMVADARRGTFGSVVVYKFDRFARNTFDQAIYKRRLKDCGVALRSVMEVIPEGPEGVILESVIAGYNEYYSLNLAQNVRRGMLGNARRCLVNGNPVFGYRTGPDGRYEVDEAEAPVVRGAFARAAAGESRKDVLAWVEAQGARTKRGSRFNYNSLRHMLANERYRGVYAWGEVRVEGGMPALVDEETWHAAQGRSARKRRRNSFPLSGRLYDWETGTPYRGTSGTSSTKRTYLYYSMPTGPHTERRYRKDDVEDAVVALLRESLSEGDVADRIAMAAVLAMADGAGVAGARAAERRIEEIDGAERNILRAVELGVIPGGTAERLEELRAERDALRVRVRAAEAAIPTAEEMSAWIRTRLCDEPVDSLLPAAVGRCAIDGDGYVHVEVPWMGMAAPSGIMPNEIGERPATGTFAEVMIGSPYQIRTGDLRLERAAS